MSVINNENEQKKNKITTILLILIILLGVGRLCYAFYVQKQDVHSDETWSFGLANSYMEPYIYTDADVQAVNSNFGNWTSGEVLHNYLTVQEEQRFSYSSTYYNMVKDLHPPLYFFILHTICSIFPDTFSYTYGFIINLVAYIIMSVFLFKTIKLATDSKKAGLLGVLFNSFAVGNISIFVFIRMYALSVMFAVMLTYYLFRIYKEYKASGRGKTSSFVGAAITTLLGALTHHFFLVYAFMITAVFVIYYMIKKSWNTFIKLVLFMLAAVGLSILLFPATIDHIFSGDGFTSVDGTAKISSFKSTFFALIMHMSQELFGFSWIVPYKSSAYAYVIVGILMFIFLLLGLIFLFRHEEWFPEFKAGIKGKLKQLLQYVRKPNILYIALFFSITFVIAVASRTINYADMLEFSDRYIFIAFPAAIIFVTITTHALFTVLRLNKKIRYTLMTVLILISLTLSNVRIKSPYLNIRLDQYGTTLADISSGDNDVIMLSSAAWLLTCYSARLDGVNSFFYAINNTTNTGYWTELEAYLEALDSDRPLYLVLDVTYTDIKNIDVDPNPEKTYLVNISSTSADKTDLYDEYKKTILDARKQNIVNSDDKIELYDYLSYVNDLSICKKLTFVGQDWVFQRPVLIYKLN